jgi:hypothetical protein
MALPAQLDRKLAEALARELAYVQAEERAAYNADARSAARAGRNLYNVHVQLAGARRSESPVNIAKLEELLQNIARVTSSSSVILTEADRRSLVGATKEIGAGMAKDAADVALDTARAAGNVGAVLLQLVRFAPYLLVAFALWHFRRELQGLLK